MPYYEFSCWQCPEPFLLKRSIDERDEPATCPRCLNEETSRNFSVPSVSLPGQKTSDTWEDWYQGREAGPGMSRERTMQMARKVLKDAPKSAPVTAKTTQSLPGSPAKTPN